MEKFFSDRGRQLMSAALSMCFLMIHILMLVIFSSENVTPMARFNYFSVAFYIASFYIIYKNWLNLYVVLTYYEVVVHMFLAVLFVGWESGFQITLIGMNILVFFTEYVSRTANLDGKRYIPAVPMSIVGMCAYLSSYITRALSPAPYTLPPDLVFWLNIAWGLIVFVINIFCLQGFVLMTFTSEKDLTIKVGHDSLTGLPNRYAMTRFLNKVDEKEGLDGRWLAIGDIDDFKHVNDTYGHNCGDYVLKTISDILAAYEGCDQICRWGGEEFLLTGTVGEDMEDVKALLDRLRISVAEHSFWHEEKKLSLTITLGAVAHEEGENLIEWVNRADKLLYKGKTSGKNQVVIE